MANDNLRIGGKTTTAKSTPREQIPESGHVIADAKHNSLWGIAQHFHGVSWSDLKKWNPELAKQDFRLKGGEKIHLRDPNPVGPPAQPTWAKAGTNDPKKSEAFKGLSPQNQAKVKDLAEQGASPTEQRALGQKLLGQQQAAEKVGQLVGKPVDESKMTEDAAKTFAGVDFSSLSKEQKQQVAKTFVDGNLDGAKTQISKFARENNTPGISRAVSALKDAGITGIDSSKISDEAGKIFASPDFIGLKPEQRNEVTKQFAADIGKVAGSGVGSLAAVGEKIANFKKENSPQFAELKKWAGDAKLDSSKISQGALEVFGGKDFAGLVAEQKQAVAKSYLDGKYDVGAAKDQLAKFAREGSHDMSFTMKALSDAGVKVDSSKITDGAAGLFMSKEFQLLTGDQQKQVTSQYAKDVNEFHIIGNGTTAAKKLVEQFTLENDPNFKSVKSAVDGAGVKAQLDPTEVKNDAAEFFKSADFTSLTPKQQAEVATGYAKTYDTDAAKQLVAGFKHDNDPQISSAKEALTKLGAQEVDAAQITPEAAKLFANPEFTKLNTSQKRQVLEAFRGADRGYHTDSARQKLFEILGNKATGL